MKFNGKEWDIGLNVSHPDLCSEEGYLAFPGPLNAVNWHNYLHSNSPCYGEVISFRPVPFKKHKESGNAPD